VAGAPGSLDGLTREELAAFARTHLAPGRLVISIVSPWPAEDVAAAVEERFASAHPGPALGPVPPIPVTSEPGPPVVVELGAPQARLQLGRIAPLAAEDRAGLRLLAAILSHRLARTIREEQGLAYSLGASASVYDDHGWLTVVVDTRADNLEAARAGVGVEMQRLRESMAEQDEVDRVRATRRARALMRRLPAVNRARALGMRAFTGRADADDADALVALDRVGREELARLARTWLLPERFRVVVVR
jgi:predicted Zn-dependent peptidase